MASTINASTSAGLVNSADTSGVLQLQTANTTAVTIDASQNVGIGTSNPSTFGKFAVVGNDGYISASVGSTTALTNYIAGDIAYICASPSTGSNGKNMVFQTGSSGLGTERMRIDSSGNLLVGTASLGVSNASAVNLRANNSAGGSVLVGHANGTVNGNSFAEFWYSTNQIGNITQNSTSTVAYNTSSDYRLKENIAPMTGALEKVSLLKPVTYKWKADGSDGQGFIAHELQAVVPDCVTGKKDAVDAEGKPVYQGIDTSFLVATLTKAIQELNDKIIALEAQLGVK